ncbi:MAG: phospholipid carrier-dependent glycosyltransferase, partial [Nitrospinota bacterium]
TYHLISGYTYLQTGDFRLGIDHPPLLRILAALPLLWLNPSLPLEHPGWQKGNAWELGRQFFRVNRGDIHRLLFWSRLPLVLLATLLGYCLFRWAQSLYGDGGGLMAVVLYSFEPNILAHSRLVTTDFGVSAFMLLTMYTLWRYTRVPSMGRLLVAGVSFGLALASKFTALILTPLIPFLLFRVAWEERVEREEKAGWLAQSWLHPFLATLGIFAIALGVLRLTYGPAPGLWLYQKGLHSIYQGHSSTYEFFLLGNYSRDGWWYYYLVAFVLKTPLPLLLLFLLSLVLLHRQKPSLDFYFLLLPILTMFIVSTLDAKNMGLRRILPLYPFLFVLCSSLVQVEWKRRWVCGGIVILCAWQIFASLQIYPHYLSYFNELTGGPERGIFYLDDSNIDWGQDLIGLKRFVEEEGIDRLKVDYFGSITPDVYGIPYEPVSPVDLLRPQKGVYYAISAHILQRKDLFHLFPGNVVLRYDWLEKYTPVRKIGYSIYIYKF